MRTSPSPGTGVSTSSTRSTSTPPVSCMRIAFISTLNQGVRPGQVARGREVIEVQAQQPIVDRRALDAAALKAAVDVAVVEARGRDLVQRQRPRQERRERTGRRVVELDGALDDARAPVRERVLLGAVAVALEPLHQLRLLDRAL